MDLDSLRNVLAPVAATACVTTLGFAVKGAIDWQTYRNNPDAESRSKSRKGMICLRTGLIGLVVAAAILLVPFMWNPDETNIITEPEVTEPEDDDSGGNETPVNPEKPMSKNYVISKRYDGGTYTGFIDPETEQPSGKGMMVYLNNNDHQYNGEWVDGQRHGVGTMIYRNGDKYEGEWKNGKRDGSGTYTWKNQQKYIGDYKNDMRDGEGEYIGWTGYTGEYGWSGNYYGLSKENYFEGDGRFEFENGDRFVGTFHTNQFWNGVYTRSDSTFYKIENGKPSA